MNTPTLTIKEFIEKLNNKNQIEEENKDTQKTNEKIKLKILQQKQYASKLKKTILSIIPSIKEEEKYSLLLWTKLALYLRIKNDVNSNNIINEYLEWRKFTGKSFYAVKRADLDTHINIDAFILKKLNPEEFCFNWVCVKPALSKIPYNKNKKDISKMYGINNIAKIKSCLETAFKNKTIKDLMMRNIKSSNDEKIYVYYKTRESLYNELKSKHDIKIALSSFKGIISSFVEIKYK